MFKNLPKLQFTVTHFVLIQNLTQYGNITKYHVFRAIYNRTENRSLSQSVALGIL